MYALLALLFTTAMSLTDSAEVFNPYLAVERLNSTHCSPELACPKDYLCYKLAGFKFGRVCHPSAIDMGKDLAYLLAPKPSIMESHHFLINSGLTALLMLLIAINTICLVRRTRRLEIHMGDLPRWVYDYAKTQPRLVEIRASRDMPPEEQAPLPPHNVPPAIPTSTMPQSPPRQYYLPQRTRPVMSPNFPRAWVPEHLSHLAYQSQPIIIQSSGEPIVDMPENSDYEDFPPPPPESVYLTPSNQVAILRRGGSLRRSRRSNRSTRSTRSSHHHQQQDEQQPCSSHQMRSVQFSDPPVQQTPVQDRRSASLDEFFDTKGDDTVEGAVEALEKAMRGEKSSKKKSK